MFGIVGSKLTWLDTTHKMISHVDLKLVCDELKQKKQISTNEDNRSMKVRKTLPC